MVAVAGPAFGPSSALQVITCIFFFVPFHRTCTVEKLVSQVLSSDATQFRFYFWLFFRLVPEEEHPLCQFLARRFRAIYRFERIRMVTCGPSLSAHGHGSGRKVLHLFQLEVHPFRQHGQLRHVFFRATRMAADEVRDDLLAQPGFPVNSIEYVLKLPK